jgi:hypothetical protein
LRLLESHFEMLLPVLSVILCGLLVLVQCKLNGHLSVECFTDADCLSVLSDRRYCMFLGGNSVT